MGQKAIQVAIVRSSALSRSESGHAATETLIRPRDDVSSFLPSFAFDTVSEAHFLASGHFSHLPPSVLQLLFLPPIPTTFLLKSHSSGQSFHLPATIHFPQK